MTEEQKNKDILLVPGDLVVGCMNPSHLQKRLIGVVGIVIGRSPLIVGMTYWNVLWSDGSMHHHPTKNLCRVGVLL